MSRPDHASLRTLSLAADPAGRWLSDERGTLPLSALATGSSVPGAADLRDRCVLIRTAAQRPAVLAALALDGVARRILFCPPDLDPAHLPAIAAEAGVDAVLTDGAGIQGGGIQGRGIQGGEIPVLACFDHTEAPADAPPDQPVDTEWVLFTSGTTGRPKMVLHSLASLSGPLNDGARLSSTAVWSTFYDVRRYGGLQILLRALLGGGSMVLSGGSETAGDFLARAAGAGVTHISGTPSHWRRALMSPAIAGFAPDYVRLSGEPADQSILDRLRAAFPAAGLSHAFASTEAGVAFDVRDGRAGLPAAFIDGPDRAPDSARDSAPDNGRDSVPAASGGVQAELRLRDGVLEIRSNRVAARYLGAAAKVLAEADGFVSTGDMLERRDDRYVFIGRREGVINVGGQKVYPEEVEAVINRHPDVRASRVHARHSPITGAVVTAELVLRQDPDGVVRDEIMRDCRAALAPHKVPVALKLVAALDISAAGKLVRHHA